jgi:hypothetical protein
MKYLAVSILLAVVLAGVAAAQAPASEPATCSLSGVVKEAATHVPLEGVRVWAGQADATTGPQGQFAFPKLEPGRHWVSVYDRSRAASGGAYVLLNPGQELAGLEIYIKAGGSISGRVLDEDRQPVSGAAVVLLEATFEFGRTAYRPNLTVQTDSNGDYRLQPVPSGRSFLILAKKPLQPIDAANPLPADPEKRPRVPLPAFYPASPDIDGGQAVTLAPAEDRRAVDIQMTSAPVFCIGGTVHASSPPAPGELTIAEQLPLVFASSLKPVTIPVSDGSFRACGFHPGEYQLRASASAQVVIAGRDVDDVQLQAVSVAVVPGNAVWEPPPQGKAADTRVRIGLKRSFSERHADEEESSGIFAMSSNGGSVQVPGPFTLMGSANDYTLDIGGLPPGCYVKEATYAGADVRRQPVRLTQAAGGGQMHLALACDAGSLTARVTDRDGNAVSHVHLYIMPEDAGSAAALSDVLERAEVDNGWSEAVKPLPPGKYLAVACDLELDGAAEPILKLWRGRSKAKEVEIAPGEAAQVTLEIAELN